MFSHADLNLLSRIPGRPYKEPAEIKMERDDSLDRDSKDFNKQSSEKSSSKGKRKHKVRDSTGHISPSVNTYFTHLHFPYAHTSPT